MKFLFFVFIFISCCTWFALSTSKKENIYDKVSVSMVQSVAIPGGTYAPLENAQLHAEKIQNGVFNLKYDFTVNAEKNNEKSIIAMHIDFPAGIKAERLTFNGIPHIDKQKNEYYISQRKDGTGCIEFEVKIPDELYDKKLPVDISFKYYEVKDNYMDYIFLRDLKLSIANGIIFGTGAALWVGVESVPVGVLAGVLTIAVESVFNYANYSNETSSFDKILGSVKPEDMKESKKHFAISVIN